MQPLTHVPPVGKCYYECMEQRLVNHKMLKILNTYTRCLVVYCAAAGYYRDFLDISWIYNNYRPEMQRFVTLPNLEGLIGFPLLWNDIYEMEYRN